MLREKDKIFNPTHSRVCEKCGNMFYCAPSRSNRTCSRSCGMHLRYQSEDERKRTSAAVKGKTGGWRNFGGNGIKGEYCGIIYQSSWELAWIIYHIDHNIKFRRCTEFFIYDFKKSKRKYYPDFFLIDDNTYIEIKGFWSEMTQAKIDAVKKHSKIEILTKKEMHQYLEYAKNTHAGKVLIDTRRSSKP